MAGLTYQLELKDLDQVQKRLGGLAAYQISDLAFDIGALLESSTKERIATEKHGPDGEAWPAWSPDYAATRGGQHSLLVGEGDLMDSIQNYSAGDIVEVGTNLVYGAIHHFGGKEVGSNIPARPWLGLSADDRDEITTLVIGDIEEVVQ